MVSARDAGHNLLKKKKWQAHCNLCRIDHHSQCKCAHDAITFIAAFDGIHKSDTYGDCNCIDETNFDHLLAMIFTSESTPIVSYICWRAVWMSYWCASSAMHFYWRHWVKHRNFCFWSIYIDIGICIENSRVLIFLERTYHKVWNPNNVFPMNFGMNCKFVDGSWFSNENAMLRKLNLLSISTMVMLISNVCFLNSIINSNHLNEMEFHQFERHFF